MITLLNVIKDGNRIRAYSCTDGVNNFLLSKQEVIEYIRQGQVTNGKVQRYNNSDIIRILTTKKDDKTKPAVTAVEPFDTVTNGLNPMYPY